MKLTYLMVMLSLLLCLQISAQVTLDTFDDGVPPFNVTQNSTYHITFQGNDTISTATMSVTGLIPPLSNILPISTYIPNSYFWTDSSYLYDGSTSTCGMLGDSYQTSTYANFSVNGSQIWADLSVTDYYGGVKTTSNYSLPSGCINNTPTQIMVNSNPASERGHDYYCWDGTLWQLVAIHSDNNAYGNRLCDVHVVQYFANVDSKIYVNGTMVWSRDGIWSGTDSEINLSVNGTLQLFLTGEKTVSITIGGSNFSQLQINSLAVYYGNIVQLNVYSEETGQLINDTFSVMLLDGTYNRNFTFGNGSLFLSDLPVSVYEIRLNSTGYAPRAYFFTLERNFTSIDLYTLPMNATALTLFQVPDEKGNPLYNGTIKMLRYFIEDNAYLPVAMEKIDDNGLSGIYLVPNTVYYEFILERDGIVYGFYGPQKVFSSNVILKANTVDEVLESWNMVNEHLSSSLAWDNDTNVVTYTWNDAKGITTQGCLSVLKNDLLDDITYGPECATGAAGSVSINMTPYLTNATYVATGKLTTSSRFSNPVTNIIQKVIGNRYAVFDKVGLYMSFFFVGTLFFLGLPAGFGIGVILAGVAMFLVHLLGVVFFSAPFIAGVVIIGLTIAVVNKQ